MAQGADAEFAAFVASRQVRLQRIAWVLTGDWTAAEDLVQTVLAKVWRRWDRVSRVEDPDGYVRRMLVNVHVGGLRRRWHGEQASGELPDLPGAGDVAVEVVVRLAVTAALGALPARQRAVLALRFLEDLSEAQTAEALGCAPGTVKSLTAKALTRLRAQPSIAELIERVQS